MITKELIRTEFVHSMMNAGLKKIYSIQQQVIAENLNSVSGDLASWAKRGRFDFTDTELNNTYYISVLPYLRFLDISYRKGKDRVSMSLRRKLALYNRAVWGVLYGETFPAIRYGFRLDVQKYIREQLEQGLAVDAKMIAALDDF